MKILNPMKNEHLELSGINFDTTYDMYTRTKYGIYYTPKEYSKSISELVHRSTSNVDKYTIIDRCAGTGNLELYLTKDELQHTWLNTIEVKEYNILKELYKDKVLSITNIDALSKDVIHEDLRSIINNKEYKVILLENPPFFIIKNKLKYNITLDDPLPLFLSSGFNHYLRNPDDEYILVLPNKRSTLNLINKTMLESFTFQKDNKTKICARYKNS